MNSNMLMLHLNSVSHKCRLSGRHFHKRFSRFQSKVALRHFSATAASDRKAEFQESELAALKPTLLVADWNALEVEICIRKRVKSTLYCAVKSLKSAILNSGRH